METSNPTCSDHVTLLHKNTIVVFSFFFFGKMIKALPSTNFFIVTPKPHFWDYILISKKNQGTLATFLTLEKGWKVGSLLLGVYNVYKICIQLPGSSERLNCQDLENFRS